MEMEVRKNEGKNGVELYFECKPGMDIIQALKWNEFRWHKGKGCWYAKDTDERESLIERIKAGEKMESKNDIITPRKNDIITPMKKKTNKGLIAEAGRIYGDEACFLKWYYDAIELEDGRILCIDKINIKKDFCFGEHGYDYDEVIEQERGSRCWEYFRSENLKGIEKEIEALEECIDRFDDTNPDSPFVLIFKQFWTDGTERLANYGIEDTRHDYRRRMTEFEITRKASFKEVGDILRTLKEQKEDLEKRLAIWWKKNGAEGLHTWTYWADA